MKLKSNQYLRNFDWIVLAIIGAIVFLSLILIANAGFNPFAEQGQSGFFGILSRIDFKYVFLQASWFLLGLVIMTIMVFLDYHTIARWGKLIYIANVSVLALLLIFARDNRGVKGWIDIGTRAIQPAEICKITIMIYIGKLLAIKSEEKGGAPFGFMDILPSAIYFAVPFILTLLQPDFGTAMVYVAIYGGMLITVGIEKKVVIIGLVTLAVVLPVGWLLLEPWQRQRITGFLGDGVVDQVEQSKTLIGSGRIFGKGFFQEGTLSSLNFMAEQHTDFIFALAVETMGFLGGMLIILLYFALLFRLLFLSKQSSDIYGTLLIMGVFFMFLVHVFENIAMTMGVMPVTGIPAPFLSYGGSSMITNMMAIGLVQSVVVRRDKPYYGKL